MNYGPNNWECFTGSLFFSQGTDCLVLSFDKSRKVASLRDAAQKYATRLAISALQSIVYDHK